MNIYIFSLYVDTHKAQLPQSKGIEQRLYKTRRITLKTGQSSILLIGLVTGFYFGFCA